MTPHQQLDESVTKQFDDSIKHWRKLAASELRMAVWDVHMGIAPEGMKTARHHKAEMYEDTARALLIERDTGVVTCVCHLIPMTECARRAATKGSRR